MKPYLQKVMPLLMTLFLLNNAKVNAQYTEFYGTTYKGGKYSSGTIFKTDGDGNNLNVIYNFPMMNEGIHPVGSLCAAPNGKFYGITTEGGYYKDNPNGDGYGILFEWDPITNEYNDQYNFTNTFKNGRYPKGSLIYCKNGKLYGTTSGGGETGNGVLFEWDLITNTYTKKLDFGTTEVYTPAGCPIEGQNEKLYWMTEEGNIIEWDPINNKYTKKYQFNDSLAGINPFGTLMLAKNGNFFGMTTFGGKYNDGVLFEWNPTTNEYLKRYDFTEHGYQGTLVQANNGKIYGINDNTLFEWDPIALTYSQKYIFNNNEEGTVPRNNLIQADNGKIFGTTVSGGVNKYGVLFQWDINSNTYTKLLDFDGPEKGRYPESLTLADNNRLYGITNYGGCNNSGVIFEWNINTNTYTKKIDFNYCINGSNPIGSLTHGNNKKVYGTTSSGGKYGLGVLYELAISTNTFIKKIDFNGEEKGSSPCGFMILGNNGKLIGMTQNGGKNNNGLIYEWDPVTNDFSIIYEFEKIENGIYPVASLVKANNGKLYGLTDRGGLNNFGVIFEWDPVSNVYIKKFDFEGLKWSGSYGLDHCGSLTLANNGKLYGINFNMDETVIYEWDPVNNIYSKRFDKREYYEQFPACPLIQVDNGKFFVLKSGGIEYSCGQFYEWDTTTNILINRKKINHFISSSGSLLQAKNGKIYGTSRYDGLNYQSVLYEWDPVTYDYIPKESFNEKNGSVPNNNLIEIRYSTSDTINAEACNSYTSPSGKTWTCSGIYHDTISNAAGSDSIFTIKLKIKKSTTSTIFPVSNNSYTSPSGKIWAWSGNYIDTIPNAEGCDSVININLIINLCSEFYGITAGGGEYNVGTIFKTDENGENLKVIKDFTIDIEGTYPTGYLCKAKNGKLYGMTTEGGLNNGGVIFEWDPITNTYIKKLDFNWSEKGGAPEGNLLFTNNGKLYGMTSAGGANYYGVIFEWDPLTDVFTKKYDFDGKENGGYPIGSLLQADNGKLYGTAYFGGANGHGILFEWDPITDKFTKKMDFNEENGSKPHCTLIKSTNGKLYGLTPFGGTYNQGVIFEWDPVTNIYIKMVDFNGIEKGRNPFGSLMQASNGEIYGMTNYGGVNDDGVLFEWDPMTNIFIKKVDFDVIEKGWYPSGSLMQATNGKLYGMTAGYDRYGYGSNYAGKELYGTLFEWDPATNNYLKLIDFNGKEKGLNPHGALIQTDNGKLYGMTNEGGASNCGVIFEWDIETNAYTKKIDFNHSFNGHNPYGPIVQSNNFKLYGTTYKGGTNGYGVIFEWDTRANTYTKKFDFSETDQYISLTLANNGKLYGIAPKGGENGQGMISEWDPVTNLYSIKYEFNEAEYGRYPKGILMQAANGKLYGVTTILEGSGLHNNWTIFEWDPSNNTYTKKLDLDSVEHEGINPTGHLIQTDDGTIYGTTISGGINCGGFLFEYDPDSNIYNEKFKFCESCYYPYSPLIKVNNGKLYGMAYSSFGLPSIIFDWNLVTKTYSKIYDIKGYTTIGSLMQAKNGKLYGMAIGGINGEFFEWDPLTNTYTKKGDIDGRIGDMCNGDLTGNACLIEITYSKSDTINDESCNSYTSPSGKYKWTCSGTYKDTIQNSAGCDSIIVINLKIKKSTKKTICPAVCDSYTSPSGKIWTCSGTYKDTIPNSVGCDSVITVKLKIKKSTTSTICPAVCDNYTSPSGKIFTCTGTYQDTIPNAAGCDSIITVNLTIKKTASIINPVACYSYISPSGKIWINSGEYLDTVTNTVGCDSIITVNLTVNSANSSVMQDQKMLTANASGAIYQWLDCNNSFAPIEGKTKQTFTADEAGHYAVIVSENGCTDTSDCYYVNSSNSLDLHNTHDITLYPNPTDGSIYINLDRGYTNALLTISSYDGKVIQKENYINIQVISLKLAQKPGIYIATVACENETLVFKIVKY